MAHERKTDAVVDLLSPSGTGPLWGLASSDLNATLLAWPPGHELVADTNRVAARNDLLGRLAKTWALLLRRRAEVYPEDVQDLAPYVLAHQRLRLGPHAASRGVTVEMVIDDVVETALPGAMSAEPETRVDLAQIAQIELFILKRMKEFVAGDHGSVFKGSGFNFAGVRDWQPGDAASSIDWAQSSLTNFSPFVIREHEQNSTASIVAAVDASLSTRCGANGVSIGAAIARAVAAVGLSAVLFQDQFGVIAFDERFRECLSVRPRIGKPHVVHCLDLYLRCGSGVERGSPSELAASISAQLRKTSLVPVISDWLFAEAPEFIEELALLNAAHDVFLMFLDVRFAFSLPDVSIGLGRGARRRDRAHARAVEAQSAAPPAAGRRLAKRFDPARPPGGPRQRACGARPVRDGERARAVRRGAALAEAEGGAGRCGRWVRQLVAVKRDMQWRAGARNAEAFLVAVACAAVLAAAPARVAADNSAAAHTIDSDPIRCWWKSDKTAVQVAERFVVTLTCGVIETRRVMVVPDLDQLDAAALQLAPFEVLHGVAPWGHRGGIGATFSTTTPCASSTTTSFVRTRRFPRYRSRIRFRPKPARWRSKGASSPTCCLRCQMRIHSVVPKGAKDIRDAPRTSFADIDARAFRAAWEQRSARGGLVRVRRGVARRRARTRGGSPARARACGRAPAVELRRAGQVPRAELEVLSAAAVATPATLARALAALRVAGAVALSGPVTHARGDTPPRVGQLAMRSRWLNRKSTLVSAAVTARTLARALERAAVPAVHRPVAEELRDVLATLTAVCYGRDAKYEAQVLIRALQRAAEAVRRLRMLTLWPRRSNRDATGRAAPLEDVAWSR